jgi:hypothetical protein
MTIYTLYIKTHKITGLKYLGKTIQNPFKYNGSGTDWKLHLKKYGNDHYTELVMECQSKEEFKYWGIYYSQLWNIVNAQDDYGNKIWANRIPETGAGPVTAWNKGKTGIYSDKTIAKMSASATGRGHTDQTKEKLSDLGKKKVFTEEYRAKLAEASRGQVHSPERVAKMVKTLTGRKLSPEHRAAISAGNYRRWAKPDQ